MNSADLVADLMSGAAPAWEMVKAHPWLTLAGLLLSSGAGANVLARILNRIPLGPWFAVLEVVGRGASRMGNMKFSRPLWEPIETWFIKALAGSVQALANGLQADRVADGAGTGEKASGGPARGLPVDPGGPVPPPSGGS